MTGEHTDKPDRDGDYVRLHRDSEYVKERENGLSVECPHCGEWNDSHELLIDDCGCGAEVSMWERFDQSTSDSGGQQEDGDSP